MNYGNFLPFLRFYRVPAENRDLNYDKFFREGDVKRVTIEEFYSDNTRRLNQGFYEIVWVTPPV